MRKTQCHATRPIHENGVERLLIIIKVRPEAIPVGLSEVHFFSLKNIIPSQLSTRGYKVGIVLCKDAPEGFQYWLSQTEAPLSHNHNVFCTLKILPRFLP
jgi:hypothetical protein